MAKRKKKSKVLKRGKLRRVNSVTRGKARKSSRAKAAVAKAKPKRAPVKKAAPRIGRPVVTAVETVAVEIIERPARDAITVTEVEETRKAS